MQYDKETTEKEKKKSKETKIILNKSKMIKNPFAKNDVGCSFMCFFTLFLGIQFMFLWFFIKSVYVDNYKDIIIQIAKSQGY
jgi:hypothetical protein